MTMARRSPSRREQHTSEAANAAHATATVDMLAQLEQAGLELRQVPHTPKGTASTGGADAHTRSRGVKRTLAHSAPAGGASGGRDASASAGRKPEKRLWPTLPRFPSAYSQEQLTKLPARQTHVTVMGHAFARDAPATRYAAAIAWDTSRRSISTNLVGRRVASALHSRRGGGGGGGARTAPSED
jgi:hypothetical protein